MGVMIEDMEPKRPSVRVQEEQESRSGKTSESKKKLAARRGTQMPIRKKKPESTYKRVYQWWHKVSVKYAFSHPHVRSRLEKLMGSNVVSLTDRAYMQHLQERILEDYAEAMLKRIAAREAEEMERVKNLVLSGKIPLDQAPPEMANHPVRLIELYCQKLIAERRAKIKVPTVNIPKHLYWDDTPDPPSGLSIENGHIFRSSTEKLCHPPDSMLHSTEEDVKCNYMFTEEEFAKLYFENPLIQKLRECETVEQMYQLADEIIGVLKTLSDGDEVSTTTTISAT